MSDTTDTRKRRTITLTDRAPVRIIDEDWPIIAEGSWSAHDGQVESEANRTWDLTVRVRQHTDGRTITYGVYHFTTTYQGQPDCNVRVGSLHESYFDLPTAILEIGDLLAKRLGGEDEATRHIADVVAECIAALPPEDLT